MLPQFIITTKKILLPRTRDIKILSNYLKNDKYKNNLNNN